MRAISTSGSEHKITAIMQAVKDSPFEGTVADVLVAKGTSEINKQPHGMEETQTGALNRLKNADIPKKFNGIVVSIENGVDQFLGRRYDFAIVIILHKGHTVTEISQMMQFPDTQFEEAYMKGFATTTVGDMLLKDGIVEDGTDPHFDLSDVSRLEILTLAIRVGLGKLHKMAHSEK